MTEMSSLSPQTSFIVPSKLPPPAEAFKPMNYGGTTGGSSEPEDNNSQATNDTTTSDRSNNNNVPITDVFSHLSLSLGHGGNNRNIENTMDEYAHNEEVLPVQHTSSTTDRTNVLGTHHNSLLGQDKDNSALFGSWDKSWGLLSEPELTYTRSCFASYCVIFSPIPHALTKLSGVTVPLKVIYLLWNKVLKRLGCEKEAIDKCMVKVMNNLSDKMGFLDVQKVAVGGDKVVDCVSFSHEIYREYGKTLVEYSGTDYKSAFIEILFKSIGVYTLEEEDMDELLICPKPIDETYYYIMLSICYLHPKSDRKEPCWYLFQPNFIKCRLETLGILHGTLISLSDIEHFCDSSQDGCTNMIQSFECIASHLHAALNNNDTTNSNCVEIGMEIARSFESMATSLSRRNQNPMKYHHEALAVYEELLDDSIGINRTPLKDILQLDMAETLQNLGNCIAFERRGLLFRKNTTSSSASSSSYDNPISYYKSPNRVVAPQESSRQMNHKAMKFYDRAFQVRRVLLGNHHPLLANTLQCIGVLYFEAQLYSYAVSCFLEALRIRRLACEEYETDHTTKRDMELSTADTLEWIGHAYREMKKFHSSITALSEALVIQTIHCGNEHEDVAALHQNIGVVYDDLREYQTSLGRYGEALRIRRFCLAKRVDSKSDTTFNDTTEEICLKEGILETLCCMGNVYSELENTNYALECYREAMSLKFSIIHERFPSLGKWHMEKDDSRVLPLPMFFHFTTSLPSSSVNMMKDACLTTLTSIYAETELHDDFLEEPATKIELLVLLNIMARVVELTLTKYGSDHMYVCNAFFQMADIYLKTANYNKASKCLEEVLRILAINDGVDDCKSITVRTSYQLAMCCSRLGNVDRAIELYEDAIDHLTHEKKAIDSWLTQQPSAVSFQSTTSKNENNDIAFLNDLNNMAYESTKVSSIVDDTSDIGLMIEDPTYQESAVPNTDSFILLSDLYYNLGNVQSATGVNDQAFASLSYSLRLRSYLANEKSTVTNELNVANTYVALAIAFILCTGKYNVGRDILKNKVLPTYHKYLNDRHPQLGHTLYYLGQIYQGLAVFDIIDVDVEQTGQPRDDRIIELLDNALQYYNKALDLYLCVYPKDHLVIAHLHHSIGTIYDSKSEFTKAMRFFKDTLRVYLLYNNRGEHMGVSIVLNHLGIVCAAIEEDEAALKFLLESYAVRIKILGEYHVTVADSLHNLGAVYAKLEKYSKAMHCFKESLKIRIDVYGEYHLLVAKTYDNMGLVYSRLGNNDKAMDRFKASLRIRSMYLTPDDEDMACTYFNIGSVHARIGDYDLAVECFRESLRIRKLLYGNDHVIVGNILHSLGMVYEGQSDSVSAKKCYNEALEVKRYRLGDDDISVAMTLTKVGHVESISGEYTQALHCYEKALNVQRTYLGHDHSETAVTLTNIGDVWVSMGSYTTAMQYYEESLRVRELRLGEEHEDVASTLYSMGKLHDIKGDFEDAMLYYGNAYRIYNRSGRRRHDKHCRKIVEALRVVVTKSNGQVGVWDTFVVTGDCMILMERLILDLVELLRVYMVEPSRTMIKGTFLNTLKQITELASQEAVLSKNEVDKYQRAMTDYGGLLDG